MNRISRTSCSISPKNIILAAFSVSSFSSILTGSISRRGFSKFGHPEPRTELGKLGYEILGDDFSKAMPMTKIVATVGPSSDAPDVLETFVQEGLSVMRLNFSHAEYDEAKVRIDRLRGVPGRCKGVYLDPETEQEIAVPNTRAVLLDTKGPEIRTGQYTCEALKSKGVKRIEMMLEKGEIVIVTTDPQYKKQEIPEQVTVSANMPSFQKRVYCDYETLAATVEVGDKILISDGNIGLQVTGFAGDGAANGYVDVLCKVLNTTSLGSKKGVNIPSKDPNLPPLTDKDKVDLEWGIKNDIDFVAQSFVTKASDVKACKDYMKMVIDKIRQDDPTSFVNKPSYYAPKVIAKIESAGSLENFDAILEESDGIMVARGDLGVEIPFRRVTLAQKIMIRKCNEVGKPVIVATQMLESMQQSPRPTRAEVSDVTNAVYDGCDAVMLSGESANGKYPIESIQTMRKISAETDSFLQAFVPDKTTSDSAGSSWYTPRREVARNPRLQSSLDRQEATCAAAVDAAIRVNAKLIIVLVRGGTAARLLAKHKPKQPIMAFCLHPKTARQLNLHKGVYPVVGKGEMTHASSDGKTPDASLSSYRKFNHRHKDPNEAIIAAKNIGWIKSGDVVVIVNGERGQELYSSSLGVNVVEVK